MRRLALLVVLVLPLAGCGAKDAIDPVAQAAEQTGQESAEIRLSGSVTQGPLSVPLSGSGVVDPAKKKARLTIDTTVPGFGSMQVEEMLDGLTLYMRMDQLTRMLPGGKPWLKVDLEKLGEAGGVDMQALMQSGGGDPTQYLKFLEAVGDSREIGKERVNGVETTHWRATIDMEKAAKGLAEQAGVKEIPVDAWIDGDERIRRQTMAWSQQGANIAVTVDFVRFGVPVAVTAPPADQVMDFTALAGLAGARPQP